MENKSQKNLTITQILGKENRASRTDKKKLLKIKADDIKVLYENHIKIEEL